MHLPVQIKPADGPNSTLLFWSTVHAIAQRHPSAPSTSSIEDLEYLSRLRCHLYGRYQENGLLVCLGDYTACNHSQQILNTFNNDIKQWGKFSDTSRSLGSTKGFLSNSGSFLSDFRFDPLDINGVTSSTLLEISKSLAAHDRQICLTDEETDEEETDFEILQAAQSPTTPTKRKNSTPAQSPPIKSPRSSASLLAYKS